MKETVAIVLGLLEASLLAFEHPLTKPHFDICRILYKAHKRNVVQLRDDIERLADAKSNPAVHLLLDQFCNLTFHFYLLI